MNLLDQMRGITASDVTAVCGVFLATVAPGMLIFYAYDPSLLYKIETLKLLILSVSATLPLVAINSIAMLLVGVRTGLWSKQTVTRPQLLFYHSTWAFLALYSALLGSLLNNLGFTSFLAIAAIADVVIGVVVIWLAHELA